MCHRAKPCLGFIWQSHIAADVCTFTHPPDLDSCALRSDYGNCVYNRMSDASVELADEIIEAARQPRSYATQPRRGPVTQAYMQQ